MQFKPVIIRKKMKVKSNICTFIHVATLLMSVHYNRLLESGISKLSFQEMNVINKGLADMNMALYYICFLFPLGWFIASSDMDMEVSHANQNISFVLHIRAVIQAVKPHLRERMLALLSDTFHSFAVEHQLLVRWTVNSSYNHQSGRPYLAFSWCMQLCK